MRCPLLVAVHIFAGALAGALLLPAPTRAQTPPDTFRLDPLVVTATRTAQPRSAVPAAVTVLDGDELRARGMRFIADALRSVPGAHPVQVGSRGGLTSLFLRGGESDYVQVMVDGIVLNEPGGAFDFAHLTLDNVDRIEIVRGPVSVLYGSDAVAGVVHIVTREQAGPARVRASAGAGYGARTNGDAGLCPGYPRTACPESADLGSYATTTLDASVTGGAGPVRYSVAAGRHDGDGAYAFNSGYAEHSLSARVAVRAGKRTALATTTRWTDGAFRFPTDGAGRLVDRNQRRTIESLALGLTARHALSDRVELGLTLMKHSGDALTDDPPDGPADTLGVFESRSATHGERRKVDLHATLRPGSGTIVSAGLEAESQRGESAFASRSAFGPFESSAGHERTSRAAWAQLVAPIGPVQVTTGGRADGNDRFGTFLTWRAGANVRAASGLLVRAAAGTAFKEPTFFENFAEGFVTGNPQLQPEQSRSVEIGLEQTWLDGRARTGVTYFDQRFRQLIQFVAQPAVAGAPNYVNLGEVRASGLEAEARLGMARGARVEAHWTVLSTEVLDAGTGQDRLFQAGEPLIRRPTHRWMLSATSPLRTATTLTAVLSHVGARDDLDFLDDFAGARVRLPGYTTLDLVAHVRPLRERAIAFTLRVDNVLDARYRSVAHFPAAGRSLFIGVTAGS